MKILNKKEKMTVAKKRRKRLFDAALPLNYPRKASRDRLHVNERLVGAPSREPLLLSVVFKDVSQLYKGPIRFRKINAI